MEIQKYNSLPAFGAKFDGRAFKEVVEYADKTKQLRALDSALHNILHANKGDILIIHGKTPDGRIYSNFTMGKRCVQNLSSGAETPAQASFNGILELGQLGRKFRQLAGGDVKDDLNAAGILAKYSK